MIRATVRGIDGFLAQFAEIEKTFDFERINLGRTLLDIATSEIMASMDAERSPDGMPWPRLSRSYVEYKETVAPGAPMAVLHGIMKTWDQVAGERYIHRETASMTYGLDAAARIEAVKFTEGGIVTGTNQPPRPFYGLTATAAARIGERLDAVFAAAF